MNLLLTLSMDYHHESSTFQENYSFGTIETADRIFDQTRIRFYNEEGEILDSIIVKTAGICEGFISPSIGFNYLYSPVKGTLTKRENALFRLDLLTGVYKTHKYDVGVHTILADNINPNIIFFIDYENYLIKWDDKNDQEINRIKLSNYFYLHLQQDEQKIYFFGRFNENEYKYSVEKFYYLLIIDKNTLEIEKIIDFSDHGDGRMSSLIYKNQLFFTNSWKFTEPEGLIGNNILSALDLNSYQITDYFLQEEFAHNIILYKDRLLINHNMLQAPQMKKISTFDLNTHETKLYQLSGNNHYIFNQIAVQGDYLYFLDGFNLSKYDIENNFEEVAVYPAKMPIGDQKYPTFANSSHVSAFFLNPKND